MAITLTNPIPVVAPTVYDHIHVNNLEINIDQTQEAKVKIRMTFTPYALQDGVKVFSPESQRVNIDDAEALVYSMMLQGDQRGAMAMTHLHELVAIIIETNTNLGEVTTSL